MAKNYTNTYIYSQYPKYEKYLFNFIMKANRIDTKGPEFQDILYDIKRRKISDNLAKIIQSGNVVLGMVEGEGLPKVFKTFVAKDVKEDKSKIKVFIDVSGVVRYNNGIYECPNISWLISYIIDAMTAFIYNQATAKIINNSTLINNGAECFMKLFSYTIDRLYKISTVPEIKKQVDYLSILYFYSNILEKDFDKSSESIINNATKISNIDKRSSALVNVYLEDDSFNNIDTFVKTLAKLGFKDINTSVVTATWMKVFGTGTVLGMEYFPSFSAMLTDCYIGGYINSQVTIEKITGPAMVKFTKTILQIGESLS